MATLVRSPKVYPFVAWERLKPFINWKQGQHVFTSGGTGSGKSTLMGELLPRRKLVVVAVSKGMDEIFEGPYFKDYITIYKWPPPQRMPGEPKDKWTRVLLRPKPQKTLKATKVHKTEVFQEMFDDI